MPPDHNLRQGQLWQFRMVDAPVSHGSWWFAWEVFDSAGNRVAASERSFEMLSDCIADAREHGYIEPEQRA